MASPSDTSSTSQLSPSPDNQCVFVSSTLPTCPFDHLSSLHRHRTSDGFPSELEQKLLAVKNVLNAQTKCTLQGLLLIDAIQRLGIEYHFQEEINAILHDNYTKPSNPDTDDNLHEVALRFRLLRQKGYTVSAGIFDKFKDKESKFKETLNDEIEGLMSLYEASELSKHGESVLDDARKFSFKRLSSLVTDVDYCRAREVENTLKHPHHKSLAKFMAKETFTYTKEQNDWIKELQELAKIDGEMVRFQHQQEIGQVSKWWRELGLSSELKFARNEPVKWYIWCTAALADPSLSHQRVDLIKPISFVYLIDDIFDVYGELDELIVFAQIVERWDIAATEQLPDYLRICFKALNNVTNEIGCKVYKEHGWNPIDTLRKSWASLCNAFLVETKWFASGDLPNAEEYLKNGVISSGVHVVLVHLFFILGQGITKETVDFIDSDPGIISSAARILRLWDDLGSAKDENQDGYDGSYVECYMNEHKDCSVDNARKQVHHMISDAWKQLNHDFLFQNPFSPTFTKACLNVARMVPLMYNYDDNSRLPVLEDHINSLLC